MKYFFSIATILFLISCKSQSLDVSEIEFKTEACFGECPIFDILISEDGKAKYDAKMFNKQQGRFITTIKKPQLDSLTTLIENANIFSLKDNYSTLWTDHPTYYLIVKLKNGRTKTVKDYGPSGPDKLKELYKLIFSLRETQDWK